MLNCNANVIPQLSFWVEMSTASGGNRAGPESRVCLYVCAALSYKVQDSQLHSPLFVPRHCSCRYWEKTDDEMTACLSYKTAVVFSFFAACS